MSWLKVQWAIVFLIALIVAAILTAQFIDNLGNPNFKANPNIQG